MLLSKQQSSVTVLHIVIGLKKFTVACNVISIPEEVVKWAMVRVHSFCVYEMISVQFKLFDTKDAKIVVREPER